MRTRQQAEMANIANALQGLLSIDTKIEETEKQLNDLYSHRDRLRDRVGMDIYSAVEEKACKAVNEWDGELID